MSSLTKNQYLQIESIEKVTYTNESMTLKMFYPYRDSPDEQNAFDGL